MVNAAQLRRELEFLTEHRHLWDQRVWVSVDERVVDGTAEPGADWTCGTTACLAGWTALHAGCSPLPEFDAVVVDARGHHRDVRDVAVTRLDLTDDQADDLFSSGNNLRDLWELARAFTADGPDPIVVPPEVVAAEAPYAFEPEDEDHYYRALGRLP